MHVDDLRAALKAMGATEAIKVLDAFQNHIVQLEQRHKEFRDDAEKRVNVLQERLTKSLEREANLKEENAALVRAAGESKRRADEIAANMARMENHPEVREARRKALIAQAAQLNMEILALTPDPPPVTDEKEKSPVQDSTAQEPTAQEPTAKEPDDKDTQEARGE